MKILFLNPYPHGIAAGQRLKYEQFLDEFTKNGMEITHDYFMNEWLYKNRIKKGLLFFTAILTVWFIVKRWITLLTKISHYDCIYVFMWVTPVGSPISEFILRKIASKIVYDMEDAIDAGSVWIGKAAKAQYLLKVSDANIVSSLFLEKRIRNINPNTHYISSSVDLTVWRPSEKRLLKRDSLVIGWTGTYSSGAYLEPLMPLLINYCKKNNHKLLIIGDFVLKQYAEISCVEFRRWTKENEIRDLHEIDIGIYPIPDEKWVYGKSGLKLIQYLALGIPQISSNFGMNRILIKNEREGFLVENGDQWIERLEQLCTNASLRDIMGKKARATAERNHSFDTISSKYLSVLKGTSI